MQDYWHTINIEQGGHFTPTDLLLAPLLDALAAYVNGAIPAPILPTTDPVKVAAGEALPPARTWAALVVTLGPRHTDSGSGNPTLDLAGNVLSTTWALCVTTGSYSPMSRTRT